MSQVPYTKITRPKTAFIVLRLRKEIQTNLVPVSVVSGDHLGFLSVYKTKSAARKDWGKNVQLQEVCFP